MADTQTLRIQPFRMEATRNEQNHAGFQQGNALHALVEEGLVMKLGPMHDGRLKLRAETYSFTAMLCSGDSVISDMSGEHPKRPLHEHEFKLVLSTVDAFIVLLWIRTCSYSFETRSGHLWRSARPKTPPTQKSLLPNQARLWASLRELLPSGSKLNTLQQEIPEEEHAVVFTCTGKPSVPAGNLTEHEHLRSSQSKGSGGRGSARIGHSPDYTLGMA